MPFIYDTHCEAQVLAMYSANLVIYYPSDNSLTIYLEISHLHWHEFTN